jgi:Carboxypeptidase regulatory-like domain
MSWSSALLVARRRFIPALRRLVSSAPFAAATAFVAVPVRAQLVRGTVTDRSSTAPIAGVVVSLERAAAGASGSGQPLSSVLSGDRGEYAIRAPGAGQYRVSAKRIGAQRFTSAEFELGDGETKRIDVPLEAAVRVLPPVLVSAQALCASRRDQAQRLASLWEEARTALTATQISIRDRLFRARVVRYVRELEPGSLAVRSEQRREERGSTQRPFVSLSGDSLSRAGYWRELPNGSFEYNAPDADVLMSSAFLRDHCFAVVDGSRERTGLTGLAFEPVSSRRVADVRGTMWLDAATFELRFVEFRYTGIDPVPNAQKLGGEVHFLRLPSGAWIVGRWFIRIPRFTVYAAPATGVGLRSMGGLRGPTITRIIEEGGDVTAEGMAGATRSAAVSGMVLDSIGKPLPGATVQIAGTAFAAAADSAGRFHLDSLPAGSYTLIAQHPAYAELGLPVATEQAVVLDAGASRSVSFRAPNTEAVVAQLCDGKKPVPQRATVRVILLDSTTATPMAGAAVRLSWTELTSTFRNIELRPIDLDGSTDQAGAIAFCSLPPDKLLTLGFVIANQRTQRITSFRVSENEVTALRVRAARPR